MGKTLDLDDLLLKTSRTFALAIPMLPEPTRREVGVAYLLFRIADTFEDATTWPRADRIAALESFAQAVTAMDLERLRTLTTGWMKVPPHRHEGYLELLKLTPEVVGTMADMTPGARAILIKHTVRTAEGMAQIVARGDAQGNLQLSSLEDLKSYCYIVAGIVGELLTEVFLHDAPQLESQRAALEGNMVQFGEGLQLVNILKDTGDDAKDGRAYLPRALPRSKVLELARTDLDCASRYIDALQKGGAPRGYLGFTGISVMLARAALKVLDENGPGAKVSRLEVARLMGRLQATLASGASMLQATA
jgi:farnesyl-diphosphate farnesyltransferase